jgi:hypothetical protein
MDGDEDRITGHCVISLEQLCKVALSGSISSEGAIAATTVARLLVNKGRPMYNIDTKAMQVSSTHPSHQHPTHESAEAIEVMLFLFSFVLLCLCAFVSCLACLLGCLARIPRSFRIVTFSRAPSNI